MKKREIVIVFMSLVGLLPNMLLAQDEGNLTPQEKGGKWGFVSNEGKEIIAFRYERALAFAEGRAAVRLKEKWGFIDESGKIVTEMYDNVGSFSEGLVAVCKNEKVGFIDRDGKVVIPLKYETKIVKSADGVTSTQTLGAQSFTYNKGVVSLVLNGKFGLIDKQESVIAAFKYDEIDKFTDDGKALVIVDDQIKQITLSGTEENVESNWDEMPIVFNNGKINIVDMSVGIKNDKSFVTISGIGINPLSSPPTIGPKGLEMAKTPSVSILVGGTEYQSREGALNGLARTYYFQTNEQPESVIIFMEDNPGDKVSISCKNE